MNRLGGFIPRVLLVAAGLALALAPGACGGTILLTTTAQGWMTATANNGALPGNNYVAGNCGAGDCYLGEFRNFFEFDIPVLDAPVIAATLLLDDSYEALRQGPSVAYQVTSAGGSFGFPDLGNGTFYGSRLYTASDSYQTEGIALDAAALSDIQQASGAPFVLGGRVTSTVAFGAAQPDQLIFGRSDVPQQLEIITGSPVRLAPLLLGNSSPVPEPAPGVGIAAALVLLLAVAVRRHSLHRPLP